MSMWEKFKNYMDVPDVDYEDEGEEENVQDIKPVRKKETRQKKSPAPSAREDDYGFSAFDRPSQAPSFGQRSSYRSTPSHSSKVVDIHTTAKLQVVLTKPEKFSDAREIADNLNEKRTIVLNLESTNKDEALRLLDFLSGVAYANDGEIKKIAKSTFIITPYNVDVMGDLLYELESNGVFFV